MLALDSPRWKQLRHAYGTAEHIPALIRAIIAEDEPSHSENLAAMRAAPTPWEEVYNSLCHQYSIYSATYAAFPHLVLAAERSGNLVKRLETLVLTGAICAFGTPEDAVPSDLSGAFDDAMAKMRLMSHSILREAFHTKLLVRYPLAYLIQAFAALRFGQDPAVCALDRLEDSNCEIEAECPACGTYMLVDMTATPAAMLVDDRGRPDAEHKVPGAVDRSALEKELEQGFYMLDQTPEDSWGPGYAVQIAAALASRSDDEVLSARILNLHATVRCPACNGSFKLTEGLL